MSNLKGLELSRQGIVKNSRQANFRDVIYLIQAYNGMGIRTCRTENPARALTVCRPYVKNHYTVQVTAWIKVGIDCMIPMTYSACSERDLAKVFNSISCDISCALQSTQLDEERTEQREEASREIPIFK